jgi:hypothetical protein
VDNNYLDLGMNKSGFVHTLPSGRLNLMDIIVTVMWGRSYSRRKRHKPQPAPEISSQLGF